MTTIIASSSAFGNQQTKRRAIYLLIGLLVVNGLAWVWAFAEFNDNAVLMGMAFLAYSLVCAMRLMRIILRLLITSRVNSCNKVKHRLLLGLFLTRPFNYCDLSFTGNCCDRHGI